MSVAAAAMAGSASIASAAISTAAHFAMLSVTDKFPYSQCQKNADNCKHDDRGKIPYKFVHISPQNLFLSFKKTSDNENSTYQKGSQYKKHYNISCSQGNVGFHTTIYSLTIS
jgi:16S rRNA G966 N2-methylase RsmD